MPRIVRIPGLDEPLSFPTGTPDQEIVSAVIDRLFPVAPIPERPKPEAGFTGGFGEGITSLGGLGTAVPYLVAPTEERRTAAAKAAEPEAEFQGLSDIEGVGDLFRFVREQAGQAVGFMAAPAAAALGAGAVSGPFAPIAAPAAFVTTAGLQYLGNTVGRQAQEQELKALKGEETEAPDVTKALVSSAGQAGLDLAGFRFFKPLGQLIGLAGRDVAEETAKDVVETAARGDAVGAAEKLIGKESVLLGAGKGAAIEGAQEPIQSMLERYGAGLDLASDDAIQEYFEAAIAGGLLGAPLGAGSTALGNVKRGAYDNKLITDLSNAISGKTATQEELANEWDKAKASINSEVRPLSVMDDMGNFISYTPDYLSQFGVAPEASAINVGKRSVPMTDILGQSLENKEVAGVLHNFFVERMKAISDRFKEQARSLSTEERGALVKQYEMAAQGAKTMRTILTPQATLESPTNWTIRQSPDNPKKFELYNPVLGKVGAVDKEGKARLFSNTKTAGDFLKNKIDQDQREAAKEAAKVTREAEKVPKPVTTATKEAEAQKTLDEINAEQRVSAEADALAGLEADIRAGFGPEADRVFEKAQAYEDAGDTRLNALQKASTDVNQEIQADAEAETETTPLKFGLASSIVETPKVGFKTEKGSVYSLDEQGKTSRTKVSEGKGKGTTYEPHSALYVDPKDAQSILEDMQGGALDRSTSIRHGYIDTKDNTFVTLTDLSKLPAGVEPLVAVIDTKQNKVVGIYKAKANPEVGLSPIEKLYTEDGMSSTHVGNKIVELFGQPKTAAKKEAPKATQDKAKVTDITEQLDEKETADLEAGMLEDQLERGRAALTPEVNKEIEDGFKIARFILEDVDNRTFFPEDLQDAEVFAKTLNNVYKGLEDGTLTYAPESIESLRRDAQRLKQVYEKRTADRKALDQKGLTVIEGGKKKETQKEAPKATKLFMDVAEQIRALDPDPDSEFFDISNDAARARTLEEANAIRDLAERLKRANDTIKSPTASPADKDAAANQRAKIYGEMDAIQAAPPITAPAPKAPAPKKEEPTGEIARGKAAADAAARAVGETKVLAPEDLSIEEHERAIKDFQKIYDARNKKLNKQEVKETIEENGNAKEATKISNELKDQACDYF
jgi:hypothetical protein